MELNIQFDAGNVTGGLDGAVSSLERIKRLIETTTPFGEHLARGSKVEVDSLMAQMRRLVSSVDGDFKRLATSMKTATPTETRKELERMLTPLKQLVLMTAELSKAKFKGIEGTKAAAEIRKVLGEVQTLANAYDRLAERAARTEAVMSKRNARLASYALKHQSLLNANTVTTLASNVAQQPAALAAANHTATAAVRAATAATTTQTAAQNALNAAAATGARKAGQMTAALNQQIVTSKDLHSAYRGLASGFGAMWLTWGNVIPLLAGASISHSLVNAVKQGAAFGQTLESIGALGEISANGVRELNDAILAMAGKTVYGPQEVAEAMKSLALAGLDVQQQLAGIEAVLDFARTGERPLKDAAEDLVAISTAYGLGAEQFQYVGDVVTKTAAASMASVVDMAAAFRTSSSLATLYKVELKDVAVGMALMAQAGIRGQAAGTAMRQMYVELTGTTKKAAEALKRLNIDIFDDVTNKVKSLPEIVRTVAKSMEGLSFKDQMKALQDITNERGLRALGIFLQAVATKANAAGQEVSSAMQKMIDEIEGSTGFMAGAVERLDKTTDSTFRKIKGTIQGIFIKAFQDAEPEVVRVLESIHELLDSPQLIDAISSLVQLTATLLDKLVNLDLGLSPLLPGFKSFGGLLDEVAGFATVATASISQLGAEIGAALGQLGALISFDFSMIPKIKEMHDADTEARRNQLAADLERIANRGVERKLREEQRRIIKGNVESPLALAANAGLGVWEEKAKRSAGGGGGTSPTRTYNPNDNARKPKNLLADETRELQQAQATLAALQEELRLRKEFPGAYEGMSAAEKQMFKIKEQLNAATVDGVRAMTDAERQLKLQTLSVLESTVATEKEVKAQKEKDDALKKLQENSRKWLDDTRLSNSELQAQVDNFGKSKEAVELHTLQRMKDALAAGESVKVGREEIQVTKEHIKAQEDRIELMQELNALAMKQKFDEDIASAKDRLEMASQELRFVGMTSLERAKATALSKVELDYRKKIRDIDDQVRRKELTEDAAEDARQRAREVKQIEGQAAVQEAIVNDFTKMADQINQSLTDAIMRGFEDGKGFAKNFADSLKNLFKTMVLRPGIQFVMAPIGNMLSAVVSGFLGGGFGGGAGGMAGGLLSNASNISTAWNILSGSGSIGYNALAALPGGLGYGALPGMQFGSQQAMMLAAQTQGFGGAGLQATAGAAQYGGASWLSSAAAGAAVVAIPLIVGALVERNSRDRHGGAAYATSNWRDDPFAQVIEGSLEWNVNSSDLPDHAAMIDELRRLGVGDQALYDKFKGNSRALYMFMRSVRGDWDVPGFGGGETGGDPLTPEAQAAVHRRQADIFLRPEMYAEDFYRGQGFISPEELGWWNNKGADIRAIDPQVVAASRAIAESVVAPLTDMARMLGDESDYRAIAGFANRGKGALWGNLEIMRGDETIYQMAPEHGHRDFKNAQEFMRGVYSGAMDAFKTLDLPEWAAKQVEEAKKKMDALKGDKVGEEAAAIYREAAAGMAEMYRALQQLIDFFPDFEDATQDSLFALQELMGGLDALQSAYSSYLQAYWTGAERTYLVQRQLTAEFDRIGVAMPTTRDGFRELVEAQDLATEEGRKLFAELMGLAPVFAQVVRSTEELHDALGRLADLGFRDALEAVVGDVINAFGDGGENAFSEFSSQVSAYYTNFFSDEERRRNLLRSVTEEVEALGLALPNINAADARQQFRALVESLDLTTEHGRRAFAVLMGVSGAFADLTKEASEAAKSRVDKVWSRLQQLFNEQIENWRKLANEAKAIFDMASKAARDLRGQVDATRLQDARAANAFLADALTTLRATGALPDADALRNAIDDARAGLRMDDYATVAEYQRDQLVLAGQLGEIADTAEIQMTFAEQQVKLLQDQLDHWRKQMDLLRGTDASVSSIDEGVGKLVAAMEAERAARQAAEEAAADAGGAAFGGGGGGSSGAGGAAFGGGGGGSSGAGGYAGQMHFGGKDAAADALREITSAGGRAYAYHHPLTGWIVKPVDMDSPGTVGEIAEQMQGHSTLHDMYGAVAGQRLIDVAAAMGYLADDVAQSARDHGYDVVNGVLVPKFAAGGLHSGGLRLVGERGPELEVTGPARYWSFDQTGALLGGGAEYLLEALLFAVQEGNRDARMRTDNSDQQLYLLKRATNNGTHVNVKEAEAV